VDKLCAVREFTIGRKETLTEGVDLSYRPLPLPEFIIAGLPNFE
jgi:hypothetical protein